MPGQITVMESRKETRINRLQDAPHEPSGSMRYILFGMLFMNCFLLYAMRLSLSVAITAMVNSTSSHSTPSANESCRNPDAPEDESTNIHNRNVAEFDWDQSQQAMITYAFFAGYLITQIPGGYLAEMYSVTWVLGLGMGLTSVLTCFTSVVAQKSFYGLVVLRALEGLGEGVTIPCAFVFVVKWAPVGEQGLLMNLIMAGFSAGSVVTMPVAAMLCDSSLGWPASFYVFGILGLVFSILWLIFAADGPEHHRWISAAEREYIILNRPQTGNQRSQAAPLSKILLSPAVLFICVSKLGSTMNYYMILTELPSYLKYMFGVGTVENGWISGGMNLGSSISLVVFGWAGDKILVRKLVSKKFLRKLSAGFAGSVPALCMIIIPQVGCNLAIISALILINCISIGANGAGAGMATLDIAPRYAGTVEAVVNCVSNVAGVLAPEVVGLLTENSNTLHQWNLVFFCVAATVATGAIPFVAFGSVEEQGWAKARDDEDYVALYENDSHGFQTRRK